MKRRKYSLRLARTCFEGTLACKEYKIKMEKDKYFVDKSLVYIWLLQTITLSGCCVKVWWALSQDYRGFLLFAHWANTMSHLQTTLSSINKLQEIVLKLQKNDIKSVPGDSWSSELVCQKILAPHHAPLPQKWFLIKHYSPASHTESRESWEWLETLVKVWIFSECWSMEGENSQEEEEEGVESQ